MAQAQSPAQAPAAATRADEVRSPWCTAFGSCVPPPSAAPPRSERNRVCFAAARCRVHCHRLHVACDSKISAACCLLPIVRCTLSAACRPIHRVCCTLSAARCLLAVVRWMVPAAWCLLHVVSCRVPAARRMFACLFTIVHCYIVPWLAAACCMPFGSQGSTARPFAFSRGAAAGILVAGRTFHGASCMLHVAVCTFPCGRLRRLLCACRRHGKDGWLRWSRSSMH